MYLQREIIGGCDFCAYWSSTEEDNSSTWEHSFSLIGGSPFALNKDDKAVYVRAVRAF